MITTTQPDREGNTPVPEVTVVLSTGEQAQLANYEAVIGRAVQAFDEAGHALMKVRDKRLYRARFATFEEYCLARWQMSRPRAYALMSAAGVLSSMEDTDPDLPLPSNERQIRELAKAPESERAEIWRETVERTDGKPTGAEVKKTVQARTNKTAAEVTPSSADGSAATSSDADPAAVPAQPQAQAGTAVIPQPTETAADAVDLGDAASDTPAEPVAGDEVPRLVPSPVGEPGADLSDVPELGDDDLEQWRQKFLAVAHQGLRVTQFGIPETAGRADDECISELVTTANTLSAFVEKVLAARPKLNNVRHLRVAS